jgi:GGDEF domain-containing protein
MATGSGAGCGRRTCPCRRGGEEFVVLFPDTDIAGEEEEVPPFARASI